MQPANVLPAPGPAAQPPEIPPRSEATWALALRIVLVAAGIAAAVWLLVALRAIALEVLLAVVLASGLRGPVERLQRAGLSSGLSVLVIYLGALLGLGALVFVIVPPTIRELEELVADAPRLAAWAVDSLSGLQTALPFLPPLDQQLVGQFPSLIGQVGALSVQALAVARIAVGFLGGLLDAFFVLLVTLYLVVDGERVRDYLLRFLPPERRPRIRAVADKMGQRVGGWLLGQVALSATVGAVTFVGLTLLGVKGAVLLAVVAAIGEAIPMVGPILSAVPAIIVAATQGPLLALLTAVLYLLIQQLENNLLVPRVMQRAVQVHPLGVVLGLVVGSELFGVLGAVVAVPTVAMLAAALDEVQQAVGERSRSPAPPLDRRAPARE